MLAFESAVHETCRADLGKWKVVTADHTEHGRPLKIKRAVPTGGPDREIAAVASTTDMRLAENDDGFEDETARANANLMADAPKLLAALAQLVDATYLRGTAHPNKDTLLVDALLRARQLLESHADIEHAVRWWVDAQVWSAEEVGARINQLQNGEQ